MKAGDSVNNDMKTTQSGDGFGYSNQVYNLAKSVDDHKNTSTIARISEDTEDEVYCDGFLALSWDRQMLQRGTKRRGFTSTVDRLHSFECT